MLTELNSALPGFTQEIGQEGLEILCEASSLITIPAGRKLIRDGQPVDSLYLILSGALSAVAERGGKSLIVGRIAPGDWIGEVATLSGSMVASSSVIAETDVCALRLRTLAFEALMREATPLSFPLIGYMVNNMAQKVRNASLASGKNADALLAHSYEDSQAPPVDELGWIGRLLGARRIARKEST